MLLTIWLDNTYGCINKCKYCYVSHKMIDETKRFSYVWLIPFLKNSYKDIFRIEIMWHEFYNEKELLKIIAILNKFNFSKNDIFLTTNSIYFYSRVIDKVKFTISFNGFTSINKNISQIHSDIVKENLVKYFNSYENIDKINWIVWDFNINTLEEDIYSLFVYLKNKWIDTKKIYIKFLLQKWIWFDKDSIKLYDYNIKKANKIIRQYFSTFWEMIKSLYSDIWEEPIEITYCINREIWKNWYRCPWEIINEKYILNIDEYLSWNTVRCSNICSSIKWDISSNNNIQYTYYQLLMRRLQILND